MPNSYFLKQLKFICTIVIIFKCSTLFAQVPAISSFTPASGAIGTTVNISGSNFNTNPVDNIVFLGGIRATVNSATANQLTVTVPSGAVSSQISVTTKGLMSYSQNSFNITFSGAGTFVPTAFEKEIDMALPSYDGKLNSKDIDGDGKTDLIISNSNSDAISIYRNINTSAGSISASSLAAKVDFKVSNTSYDIYVEDLNGDGKPDIISYNGVLADLNVLRNTSTQGKISYATAVQFTSDKHTGAITVADMNGDGKPDIVLTNPTDKVFSILINKSTGSVISFAPKVDFAVGGQPNKLIAADFDGDGKTDLAISNQTINDNSVLSLFKNSSDGTEASFDPQTDYSISSPGALAVGDMDGDGKPDIVFSDYNYLSILQNNSTKGTISFTRLDFTDPAGSMPMGFLGDADGDGKLDVVEGSANTSYIVKNTSIPGLFSFAPAAPYDIKASSGFADLDNDGKPDIISVTYSSSPILGIVRNRVNEPAVSRISPEIGLAGTPITITGFNFSGASAVTIGGVNAASFTVNSSTSISAVVGSAATGPVVVKTKYGTGTGNLFVYGAPPPAISSFAPLLGPIGSTVTITGKNFNVTAANNIVFFGVAKATVISATATQLVVNVPVGASHQPITVTTNGAMAASSKIFDVTFAGAGPFTANSFSKRIDLPVPNAPEDALVGDLDGDGKTDIIGYNSGTFFIFRNTSSVGNTSFSPNQNITPSGSITRALIADIDADGKPDLIYVSINNKKIAILKNTSVPGTFSFAPPLIIADGANPNGMTVADFDNDGKPDIAVSHAVNNTFSVFRNTTINGNITFAAAVVITLPTLDALGGVFSGDLDGDGKIDIVTTRELSENQACTTLKNTSTIGNISFTIVNVYGSGYHPKNVIIADIDGDGKTDMAAPGGESAVLVYKNTTIAGGKMNFNITSYQSGLFPLGISIGDLDGDGQPDLVVPEGPFPGFIGVYKNQSTAGKIQLAAKVDYTKGVTNSNYAGVVPYGGSAITDFDGDGRPDMVVSNYDGNTISVSTNTTNAPVISSFTPASATAGSTITITGSNLDGTTKVSFGGVDASSFNVKSATSITAVVGDEGATGDISVTTPVAIGTIAGFTFLPHPTLESFTPLAAGPGKTVTLIGTHFTGATSVTFGGVNAKSFTVNSDKNITAVVNNVAASGDISVTVPGGKASLEGFIFTLNPIITTFTPASGPVGTKVVIAGTNFNTGIAGNIVYFGATKAVVTAATTQQLSVTVPVGATFQPISVLNTASGLTGFSVNSFLTTFKTKYSIAANDFDPNVDFKLSNGSNASAISDIDGDKKPDVIVVNSLSNTVSIFRNTAVSGSITSNSLAAKFDLATNNTPQAITIADIDGDGLNDIAVTNLGDNSVSVFLNKSTSGKISFAAPVNLASGIGPYAITTGDLDGDGKVDLITANSTASTVSVFRNLSTPGKVLFSLKVDYLTGLNPHGVVAADINGDGTPDILTANFGGGSFSILQNRSVAGIINSASFADHADLVTDNGAESIAVGDIDQNGTPDVVVANSTVSTVSVFSNTSQYFSPIFAKKVTFFTNGAPTSVTLADLDGDSRPDIVTANSTANTLSVFRNIMPLGGVPVAVFAPEVIIASANAPSFVSVGDLDGDGKPDIISVKKLNNTLSILRNNPAAQSPVAPVPIVSSFTPGKGAVSTAVTVKGNNFNTSANANIVFMGATQAKVNAATSTQLNITVPVSATYQPLSVLNTDNHLTGYSRSPFITTFASKNSMSETDISAAVNFATNSSPFGVSVGDIDGDGKPDLVITNPGAQSISVFRNTSVNGSITKSSYDAKVDFFVSGVPQKVIITDIDGDGKPDLIVSANLPKSVISVLRNTAVKGSINASSFATRVNFTVADASQLAVSDIDGDGKPDIASGNLTILLNHCQPGGINADSFPQQALYSLGRYVKTLAFYDINNDGKPDIIFNSGNGTSIVLNSSAVGNPSFGAQIDLKNSAGGSATAIADIDGDGKADIITVDHENGAVHFQRNISAGNNINSNSFEGSVDFPSNRASYDAKGSSEYLLVTDMDGDGKPDLLSISSGLNLVSFFRNISTANTPSYTFFDSKVDLAAGADVSGFAAIDIDGDGKPDIVTVNRGGNTFSILRNNPTPAIVITPPVITSFSPASGPAGTIVTIKGKNFNGVAAGNIVSFGTTNAIVKSATAQNLSVSVPLSATYEFPSVLNTVNGLTAYAPNKFISTFPSKNDITEQDFDPPVSVYTYMAGYVRVGDIDGDGKPDLIFHDGFQTLSVLRNLSATGPINPASFGAVGDLSGYRFTVGTNPQTIKVADIDGDGKPDLLVSYYSFDGIGVSVLLNRSTPGNISFAPKVDIAYNSVPFGPNFYVIETGDVDGDGKPDILIANSSLNGISVLPNTSTKGKVSFVSRFDFEAGRYPSSVNLADIDGDGKPDLVISNRTDKTISILHNIATPGLINAASFEKHVDYATAASPTGIAVGDLNADGKPDIAVVSSDGSPGISILQNKSTAGIINAASMASKINIVSQNHQGIIIADIDGDAKPDLVTDHSVFRNLKSSGNISRSSFSASEVSIMPASKYFNAYSVEDVDGDGKPDIVGTDEKGISIVRNNPIAIGQPVITSFTPAYAAKGNTITLTGTNFGEVSSVTLGGTPVASFKIVSPTSITAIVATGTSGNVAVTAPAGTSMKPGFNFIPVPTITANGPTIISTGGSVLLTANQGDGYTYQWLRDAVKISGATLISYTATQSGSYTVNVTVNDISQTSEATNVTEGPNLPIDNFKLAITSVSCKGSANGTINITAVQNLNYTATITGNGINTKYPFSSNVTINDLAAGSYSVCISITGEPNYQQCYTAVVSQPQDLSVYSTINDGDKTITLAMTGGEEYHIQLNGVNYSTKNSSITLALTDGNNNLMVTTDKLCQGVQQKLINVSGKIIPYPNPFQNTLYMNLGNTVAKNVSVEIYSISNGRKVYAKQFGDQSGVLSLNLIDLGSGLYALHLNMGNLVKVYKIEKK